MPDQIKAILYLVAFFFVYGAVVITVGVVAYIRVLRKYKS